MNVQQIVRDKNGVLVSVIENAGAVFTEKYLAEYNKDRVTIEDEYIRWYFVTENEHIGKRTKIF